MLIKGEKYACDACVRGHRVSSCQHQGKQPSSPLPSPKAIASSRPLLKGTRQSAMFSDANRSLDSIFFLLGLLKRTFCVTSPEADNIAAADRPLVHINKKGRPVSQCPHCRGLRKARAQHVKCDCAEKAHSKEDCPYENGDGKGAPCADKSESRIVLMLNS
jgi:hypothetical protein